MTEVVGEALVRLRADNTQVSADASKAGTTAGTAYSKGFLGRMKGLAAGIGLAFAGVKTVQFIGDTIGLAGDLNETISKTNVVFGDAGKAVLDFASQGAEALGQTKQQALDAASTFGVFGKAAGLQGPALSGFSTRLTSLATDLASFHNTNPEEAITALGAALRGESEPIRRFGVLLDDASLRQEALRQGLIKSTKEALTPQQKTLAAYNLILKQTADAQGDFQRTSDGLANQQRIASARWTDLKTQIGTFFLPVAVAALGVLNDLFDVFERIGPSVKNFAGNVSEAFSGVDLSGVGAGVIESISGLASAVLPIIAELGAQIGATVLPAITQIATVIGTDLVPALAAFGSAMLPVLREFAGQFSATILPAITAVADVIAGDLIPAFSRLLPILQPIASFLLEMFGTAVIGAIQGVLQALKGLVQIVSGVINLVVDLIHGDWAAAWDDLGQILRGALNLVVGIFRAWWNGSVLALFRRGILLITRDLWVGAFNGLKGLAQRGLTAAGNVFKTALAAIGRFIVSSVQSYLGLWRRLFSTLLSAARLGLSLIRQGFVTWAGAVRGVVNALINGVKSIIRGGLDFVVSAVRGLPGRIRALGGSFAEAGRAIINAFVNGLKNAGGVISGIAGNVWTALRGLLNAAIDRINAALSFTISLPGPDIHVDPPNIGHVATGTPSWRGGLAEVGEFGPELVGLPQGSRVWDTQRTSRMLQESGSGVIDYNALAVALVQAMAKAGLVKPITLVMPTDDPEAAAMRVMDNMVARVV